MTDEVSDNFFALPDGPPRDRWGRPLLIPRGGTEADRQWYTRASSLADMISDFGFLHRWQMRYLARSMGHHRDLAMLAAAECYTTGFDKGDERENRESGRRLDDIIERALDRVGIHEKADYGTAVHAWTEPDNDGFVFEEARADVDSFKQVCEDQGIAILGTELFTANDHLRVAGTFDHLCYVPGYGIILTDKKTSSKVHVRDFEVQLCSYAGADLYDWETDQRLTLEDYVARLGWDPAWINRDQALIFWIKNGKTVLHELDLRRGRAAAERAVWIRDVHRSRVGETRAERKIERALADKRGWLLDAIGAATSAQAMMDLWNDPTNQAVWTEEHTQAAINRKAVLDGS